MYPQVKDKPSFLLLHISCSVLRAWIFATHHHIQDKDTWFCPTTFKIDKVVSIKKWMCVSI
jgi:hypothetical protein